MKPSKKAEYPINEFVARRWSGRAFEPKELEEDKLKSLFEAARWSASSYNEQPWRFLVAKRETDTFEKMVGTLLQPNQVWAKNASVLVVALSKTTFDRNDRPNRHYAYDLGSSVANLSVQATALGLNIRQMGGYDPKKIKEEFQIPDNLEAFAVLAIGYLTEPEKVLTEQYAQMEFAPQERKKQDDFVYYDSF